MFEFVKPGLPLLPKYPLNLELKILSKIEMNCNKGAMSSPL